LRIEIKNNHYIKISQNNNSSIKLKFVDIDLSAIFRNKIKLFKSCDANLLEFKIWHTVPNSDIL